MSAGDKGLRDELLALPQRVFDGATRYDTDDEHVLHFWAGGDSWDIRVPRVVRGSRPRFAHTVPAEAAE